MPTVTLEVKGMRKLLRDLDPKKYDRALHTAMTGAVQVIDAEARSYPKATSANKPKSFTSGGNNTWYQRGFGPKWVRKDGSVRGSMTSEVLGKSWTRKITKTASGWKGVVGTNVSYARYVQDKTKQASFHKARGWKTVQDIVKEQQGRVKRLFEQVLRRAIK